MKYIFIAGAPGSKWSSVSKNIYFSSSIDRTDYSEDRLYYHDAVGYRDLMHMGAYFDPGMEFDLPESLATMTRRQLEAVFDAPFSGSGVRIIKSHIFSRSENLQTLQELWPDCPIVLVHRTNDSCLGWWVKCGHFDITYPLYNKYYVDLKTMAKKIAEQNAGIEEAMYHGKIKRHVSNNRQLCETLGIALPPEEYWQNYAASNIEVTVIWNKKVATND